MPHLKTVRRVAISVLALVVVVAVVLSVLAVSLVHRSFPDHSGSIAIPGLTGTVTVLRDERGVPQIYADNALDLMRAQGFTQAQDRFFEMDLRRHITAGRLSELVGADGLETDKVIRTMGWRRVAEEELPTLKPATRHYLQAYADGVNAYIHRQGSPSRMSLEYLVIGTKNPDYRVEDWSPADSLAWLKAMAWDLRGDYTDELTRARLSGRMPLSQIKELYPAYPADVNKPILSGRDWSSATAPASPSAGSASAVPQALVSKARRPVSSPPAQPADSSVTSPQAQRAYAAVSAALRQVPQLVGRGEGVGSNSWVVSGSRTSTGKPLLANDPHLAVGIPGIWYQNGLHCRQVSAACPFDVAGFSFAGLPGVVIGHNQKIAWGFTNLGPDVSDFYLERVAGETYQRDGRSLLLTRRQETIKVAGQQDQTFTVRSTVHGPLMSDVLGPVSEAGANAPVGGKAEAGRYDVSLAWTGLLPNHTADSIVGLNTATNFAQFRAAARDFAVPAQNLLYADTDGHIGYQAPGQIPIRRSATDGSPPGFWPAPGWMSEYDWKGFVPFEQMPHTLDPPEGFLVTANQEVTASPAPFLTTEWDYGFRSQRIRDLLQQHQKVTPAVMSQIQGDTRDGFAPQLVKALLQIDLRSDEFAREGQNLLRGWDFTTPTGDNRSSAAAAYYNAVWSNVLSLTFDDELPADLRASGGSQWMQTVAVLLTKPRDTWWDNKGTPGLIEGRDEILRRAMADARLDLTRELGKDPNHWQWGKLHTLELEHQVLGGGSVPGPVRWLFNRGPYEMPGGSSIVDANGWDASQGFGVNWAPSMRMVVDLSDLDASHWVNQTGNSGHAFADNYSDQTDHWRDNLLYPWPFGERAVRAAVEDTLTLTPKQSH